MTTTARTLRILALDPARLCGWAWTDGRVREYDTWDLGSEGPDNCGRRLRRLRDLLHETHKRLGFDVIACEEASFGSVNPSTAAGHNEYLGVIKLAAIDLGAGKLILYHPTTIKAFATGSGRAKKPQMVAAARTLLNANPGDDNAADALFILEMARQGYEAKPKSAKRKRTAIYRNGQKLF
jgi:Holliday junction resolvasome RuvABC endonuclease subunit